MRTRFILLLIALPFILIGLSLILSYLPASQNELSCDSSVEFYLHSNGVHLDIAFNANDLKPELTSNLLCDQDFEILSFGWGNRVFYENVPRWSDLTFLVTVKALFLEQKSLVHLTCYKFRRKDWKVISICPSQMEQLQDYIFRSFRLDDQKNTILSNVNAYTGNDYFYEANGKYNISNSCNTWVNNALKSAGLPASIWTIYDFAILHHYGD